MNYYLVQALHHLVRWPGSSPEAAARNAEAVLDVPCRPASVSDARCLME